MKRLLGMLGLVGLLAGWVGARQTPVSSQTFDWLDPARQRRVPGRLYSPVHPHFPTPVIIFSHGLGGNRDGYRYLAEAWAEQGFSVLCLEHLGSNREVLHQGMEGMRSAIANPDNAEQRPRDVSFGADQLERLTQSSESYRGHFDLGRLGVAGHSFGGHTALACVGQRGLLGSTASSHAEPRIRAALAMSPPILLPLTPEALQRRYGSINRPILVMTGEADRTPFDPPGSSWEDRTMPYRYAPPGDRYLLVLTGANHMTFSGFRPGQEFKLMGIRGGPDEEVLQELIIGVSLNFFRAYLQSDSQARAALMQPAPELLSRGRFQTR